MAYILKQSAKGYYTSLDAKNMRNSNSTVPPGTYEVYNTANDCVNITTNKNVPGWWINETESPSAPADTSESGVSGSDTDNLSDVPYDGNNASTIYTKNPHYVHPLKDETVTLYITNLLTTTTMEIDVTPNSFSESNTSNFDGQEIRGRSSIVQGYNSTGPRNVSISFTLYDDYCYYGLLNTINFLKGLMFPLYSAGFTTPPQAYIKFGNHISMKCFINVDIAYSGPKRDGILVSADISLSLSELRNDSLPVTSIEKGGEFI